MKLLWEDRAWSDYLYWQTQDKLSILSPAWATMTIEKGRAGYELG